MSMSVASVHGNGSIALPIVVDDDDCIDLTSVGPGDVSTALSVHPGRMVLDSVDEHSDLPAIVHTRGYTGSYFVKDEARENNPVDGRLNSDGAQRDTAGGTSETSGVGPAMTSDDLPVSSQGSPLSSEEITGSQEVETQEDRRETSDTGIDKLPKPVSSLGGTIYKKAMLFRNRKVDARSVDPVISCGSEVSSTCDTQLNRKLLISRHARNSVDSTSVSREVHGVLSNESLFSGQDDALETLLSNLGSEAQIDVNMETDTTAAHFQVGKQEARDASDSSDGTDTSNEENQRELSDPVVDSSIAVRLWSRSMEVDDILEAAESEVKQEREGSQHELGHEGSKSPTSLVEASLDETQSAESSSSKTDVGLLEIGDDSQIGLPQKNDSFAYTSGNHSAREASQLEEKDSNFLTCASSTSSTGSAGPQTTNATAMLLSKVVMDNGIIHLDDIPESSSYQDQFGGDSRNPGATNFVEEIGTRESPPDTSRTVHTIPEHDPEVVNVTHLSDLDVSHMEPSFGSRATEPPPRSQNKSGSAEDGNFFLRQYRAYKAAAATQSQRSTEKAVQNKPIEIIQVEDEQFQHTESIAERRRNLQARFRELKMRQENNSHTQSNAQDCQSSEQKSQEITSLQSRIEDSELLHAEETEDAKDTAEKQSQNDQGKEQSEVSNGPPGLLRTRFSEMTSLVHKTETGAEAARALYRKTIAERVRAKRESLQSKALVVEEDDLSDNLEEHTQDPEFSLFERHVSASRSTDAGESLREAPPQLVQDISESDDHNLPCLSSSTSVENTDVISSNIMDVKSLSSIAEEGETQAELTHSQSPTFPYARRYPTHGQDTGIETLPHERGRSGHESDVADTPYDERVVVVVPSVDVCLPFVENNTEDSTPIVGSVSSDNKGNHKSAKATPIRLDIDEFKDVVMRKEPSKNTEAVDMTVLKLIEDESEPFKAAAAPAIGYNRSLAISVVESSSSEDSNGIVEKEPLRTKPSTKSRTLPIPLPKQFLCQRSFEEESTPAQAHAFLSEICREESSSSDEEKEEAVKKNSRNVKNDSNDVQPQEYATNAQAESDHSETPGQRNLVNPTAPSTSAEVDGVSEKVFIEQDSRNYAITQEQIQLQLGPQGHSLSDQLYDTTASEAEASHTGDEYYTTDHTGGSYSEETDSKTSLRSLVEDNSDYDDGELYNSFTVPYMVRMLDQSCAWLEERNERFACGGPPPSLLRESLKKGSCSKPNKRTSTKSTGYTSTRPSPLITKVYNAPETQAFLRRVKDEEAKNVNQVAPKVSPTKTSTPKASNKAQSSANERQPLLTCSSTTNEDSDHTGTDAEGRTGKVEASTTSDSLTSILGEVEVPSRTEKRSGSILPPTESSTGSVQTGVTTRVANSKKAHFSDNLSDSISASPQTGPEILSQLESEISSLQGSTRHRRKSSHEKVRVSDRSSESESDEKSSFQAKLQARLARIRGLEESERNRLRERVTSGKLQEEQTPRTYDTDKTLASMSIGPEDIQAPSEMETGPTVIISNIQEEHSSDDNANESNMDSQMEDMVRRMAGGPEFHCRPRRSRKKSPKNDLSQKVDTLLNTIEEDPAGSNTENDSGMELYSNLNEDERLAALELAEKLRRRAATLKRRRKMRERRKKDQAELSSGTE